MNEKKLFQQKKQAQLNEWKAQVEVLKAKASGATAEVQLQINQSLRLLDSKIEEGEEKLSELADAGEEAWESIVDGVENAWDSMRTAVSDSLKKFK